MLQDYNVSLIQIHVNFIHWFMRCWGCNIWFILKCAEGDICVSIKMYKPCVNILWSFTRLKFFSPFLRNIFKSTLSPIIKLNFLRCVSFRILHWWMFTQIYIEIHLLHKEHQWTCFCKHVRCVSWMGLKFLKFLHKNQFYFKP